MLYLLVPVTHQISLIFIDILLQGPGPLVSLSPVDDHIPDDLLDDMRFGSDSPVNMASLNGTEESQTTVEADTKPKGGGFSLMHVVAKATTQAYYDDIEKEKGEKVADRVESPHTLPALPVPELALHPPPSSPPPNLTHAVPLSSISPVLRKSPSLSFDADSQKDNFSVSVVDVQTIGGFKGMDKSCLYVSLYCQLLCGELMYWLNIRWALFVYNVTRS